MRRTIYSCDKCGAEMELGKLWPVELSIRYPSTNSIVCKHTRDLCRNCLCETFPGVVSNGPDEPSLPRGEIEKTIGEKFEEIIREICREEAEG